MYCIVKNASLVHEQHKFFQTEEGKKVIDNYKKQMESGNQVSSSDVPKENEDLNIAPRNVPNIEVKYRDLLK